jgi:uncharacterized protein (TIGR02186 family)
MRPDRRGRRGSARLAGVRAGAPALAAAGALSAAGARAETLVTSLSSHRVEIASNYTGSDVVVFGAIERDAQTVARSGDYDVVVTVRGPEQAVVVREKSSFGPIWLNREQQKFPKTPAYLGVFASRPLPEITAEPFRRRHRVGIEAVVGAADFTMDRGSLDEPFREALVRLKGREGLYVEVDRGVTFLTPAIFRAAIPLPAIAPPGPYEVEVVLFSDGALLSRDRTHFELVKIGFEQQVGELARDRSLLYGLATVCLALLFGWAANVIFRRD